MPSIYAPPAAPLILALDTSSSLGSVALSRGPSIVKARTFEADHGHSQKLLPAVDALFTDAGVDVADVDLFAVVVGPGSFTGLRVSLASVRGLAGAKPCFGGLATDVAAWAARAPGVETILAITDLFHGEVFGSVHGADGALISARESGDLSPVLEALRPHLHGTSVAVGSAAVKHQPEIVAAFPEMSVHPLPEGLAPHLATLASHKASANNTCAAGDLMPFYLRDPLTRGLLGTQPKQK